MERQRNRRDRAERNDFSVAEGFQKIILLEKNDFHFLKIAGIGCFNLSSVSGQEHVGLATAVIGIDDIASKRLPIVGDVTSLLQKFSFSSGQRVFAVVDG